MSKKRAPAVKDQGSHASPLDQRDEQLIVGQPGFRTRRGRSGLDYIETQAEFGHSLGTLIRRLLLGKLRVRNPFYLFFLGLLGILLCLPGLLVLAELLSNPFSIFAMAGSFRSPGFSLLTGGLAGVAIVGLSALVGALLLVNVARNLYRKQKARAIR